MNREKILTKAIEKAITNGWKARIEHNALWVDEPKVSYHSVSTWGSPDILYNHDFAKALWKDAVLTNKHIYLQSLWSGNDEYPSFDGEAWQYHLQQMVIADDPIAYLGEHLT